MGDYISNKELFDFDPKIHQLQNGSGGAVLSEPPLLDGSRHGHVAYDRISAQTTRLQCRSSVADDWFSAQTSLFTDWSYGDKGTYGSSHWAIVGGGNHGRAGYFICGYEVRSNGMYAGVAICEGPGAGGSWANHLVSLSFMSDRSYSGGGLTIGCNGTGFRYSKEGSWQARVWLR